MLFSRRKRKAAAKPKKPTRKKKLRKTIKSRKVPKKRRTAARKIPKKAPPTLKGQEKPAGKVTHYFPKVRAGAIAIENGTIALDDILHIKGHTTDFKQRVRSMQIDRVPVKEASKGDEIGVLVRSRVRIHDNVYKLTRSASARGPRFPAASRGFPRLRREASAARRAPRGELTRRRFVAGVTCADRRGLKDTDDRRYLC